MTNVETDILGRIWFRRDPTIDEVGEDYVNGTLGQDEDGSWPCKEQNIPSLDHPSQLWQPSGILRRKR